MIKISKTSQTIINVKNNNQVSPIKKKKIDQNGMIQKAKKSCNDRKCIEE